MSTFRSELPTWKAVLLGAKRVIRKPWVLFNDDRRLAFTSRDSRDENEGVVDTTSAIVLLELFMTPSITWTTPFFAMQASGAINLKPLMK